MFEPRQTRVGLVLAAVLAVCLPSPALCQAEPEAVTAEAPPPLIPTSTQRLQRHA